MIADGPSLKGSGVLASLTDSASGTVLVDLHMFYFPTR